MNTKVIPNFDEQWITRTFCTLLTYVHFNNYTTNPKFIQASHIEIPWYLIHIKAESTCDQVELYEEISHTSSIPNLALRLCNCVRTYVVRFEIESDTKFPKEGNRLLLCSANRHEGFLTTRLCACHDGRFGLSKARNLLHVLTREMTTHQVIDRRIFFL